MKKEDIKMLERSILRYEKDYRIMTKMIEDLQSNRIAICKEITKLKEIVKKAKLEAR